MATTALRPVTHFTDESSTLRAFSPLPLPTRPSLDSGSTKSRKSILSHFLHVGRGAGKPVASGSKLRLASKPPPADENKNEVVVDQIATDAKNDVRQTRDDKNKSALVVKHRVDNTESVTKNPPPPQQQQPQQRPRSKSRTILRAISTTFRSRSPVSPVSLPPPSAPLSPQARQNREAALRERGLLPPKDLSQQEAEQDRHLPVIAPSDHAALSSSSSLPTSPTSAEDPRSAQSPSAADLVKREWVSKNNVSASTAEATAAAASESEERLRLNAFKFGGARNVALPAQPSAPQQLESVAEVITPSTSSHSATQDDNPPHPPEKDDSSSHGGVSPQSPSHPSAPSPIPSSPSKPSHKRNDSGDSATKPTSGETESVTTTSSSQRRSFFIPRKLSSGSPSNASPPVISLTPPRTGASGEPDPSAVPLFPHSRRSSSLKQMPSISESVASSTFTPSLDTSSRTITTTSTLNTFDSCINNPAAATTTTTSGGVSNGKGKFGMLKVKTHHHDHPAVSIPTMIVESPVEDCYKPGGGTLKVDHETAVLEVEEANYPLPASPGSLTVPQPYPDPIPAQISLEQQPVGRRGRGYTDPGKVGHRRSFLNPFKRAQSPDLPSSSNNIIVHSNPKVPNEAVAPAKKRLSVSASLTNLRKAASGLGFASSSNFNGINKNQRPKSTYDPAPLKSPGGGRRRGGFDASQLPPSPTLPKDDDGLKPEMDESGEESRRTRTTGVGPRQIRRMPTNPTLHSRGSILIEANAIEDDEVRRVTELAFLG